MLDETLVDIISMTIGAIGLIGAITRYDYPKARRTVFGENLFSLKEAIINSRVTWNFTYFAATGLLFQLIYNSILADETPDRLYNKGYYFLAFLISIALITSLIPLIKTISKWAFKREWQSAIIAKAKDNFSLAKELHQKDAYNTENNKALEITSWLEELLEIKSKNQDLKSRLEFFDSIFK